MKKTKIFRSLAIVLLLSIIIYLAVGWINTAVELKRQSELAKIQQTNLKVVDFLKLFIVNVLKNKKEVTFEERLQLENAVLDLKDPQILEQWRFFIASQNEVQAQQTTVELLEMLANKIK